MTQTKFKYTKSNCSLIQSMNSINVISTVYVAIKNPNHIFIFIPHALVCISSALFWRNCKNERYKIFDYSCVFASLLYTWYWSFITKRDIVITPLIIVLVYLFNISMHFKSKNNNKLCIFYHCLTYLVGNIGLVISFS
jgi:hypothetical protein